MSEATPSNPLPIEWVYKAGECKVEEIIKWKI